MKVVIQSPIVVMDDGAFEVFVHRGGLSNCSIDKATVVRGGSLLGRLIRALVWLGGPYEPV